MSAGKIASQAGHAYMGAFLAAQSRQWPQAELYAQELPGTKVCLQGNAQQLVRAKLELDAAGIPCFLVVDSGCSDFFDGQPTMTALGFGPALKHQINSITKRLQLL